MKIAVDNPAYRAQLTPGELHLRAEALGDILRHCTLCPHECGIDRTAGRHGVCRSGAGMRISSAGPHFGEEPPLVGRGGSGTIFFSSCTLKCVYCQNASISQQRQGWPVTEEELSAVMLRLQHQGCHNINLVTPTHFTAQIVRSLALAAARGLRLPVVYNCSGYEALSTLRLLDGIVDIYMPDIKYSSNDFARRYSGAPGYWDTARQALREMHRQVGVLETGTDGIARRGLLIRHLVLPGGLAGSHRVLEFIAGELSSESYVNIMDQYRPTYRARQYRGLDRGLRPDEHEEAVRDARSLGLHRGFETDFVLRELPAWS